MCASPPLLLPVFVFAVLGALTLALRWFGPGYATPGRSVLTALLIVAAGTLAGVAALVASSAYDYHLQSAQLHAMKGWARCAAICDRTAWRGRIGTHARAAGARSALVSRWILLTNLVLVAWVVAIMGGRLTLAQLRVDRVVLTGAEPGHRQPGPAGPACCWWRPWSAAPLSTPP